MVLQVTPQGCHASILHWQWLTQGVNFAPKKFGAYITPHFFTVCNLTISELLLPPFNSRLSFTSFGIKLRSILLKIDTFEVTSSIVLTLRSWTIHYAHGVQHKLCLWSIHIHYTIHMNKILLNRSIIHASKLSLPSFPSFPPQWWR